MTITFLYWNFNSEAPEGESLAARVALHHQADVLVLDEARTEAARVLASLRAQDAAYSVSLDLPRTGRKKPCSLQAFTRLGSREFEHIDLCSPHTQVCRIARPGCQAVLLVLVHLKSRLSFVGKQDPSRSQQAHAKFECLVIKDAENAAEHMRTVVVGDFNMNPFDPGMIDPENGFGAMMCRELALRHCPTTIENADARRFYNPLWARMGLDFPSPPGTFYHEDVSDGLNPYWHTLDQVLVRPALLNGFRDEDLRIVASIPGSDGATSPLIRSKGKHWEIHPSDHLPLLFKLDLPREERHA